MEAAGSFKRCLAVYQAIRRHIPDDLNIIHFYLITLRLLDEVNHTSYSFCSLTRDFISVSALFSHTQRVVFHQSEAPSYTPTIQLDHFENLSLVLNNAFLVFWWPISVVPLKIDYYVSVLAGRTTVSVARKADRVQLLICILEVTSSNLHHKAS
jgi:hypothetical protein